ncbi:hypothetical protein ACFPRL_31750 [Pseudoclavibacter helvolus]
MLNPAANLPPIEQCLRLQVALGAVVALEAKRQPLIHERHDL